MIGIAVAPFDAEMQHILHPGCWRLQLKSSPDSVILQKKIQWNEAIFYSTSLNWTKWLKGCFSAVDIQSERSIDSVKKTDYFC